MAETRFAIHPEDFKTYDTERVRQSFLIESIFIKDQVTCVYTHYDRLLIGGVNPVTTDVKLTTFRELMANYPLGRPAKPREIADLMAFLASDRSAYTTGVVFTVDGGISASPG